MYVGHAVAAGECDQRATCGAPALSVTAPVEVCTPPTTVVGSSVSDERVTGVGAGDDGVQRGRVRNL